MPEIPKTSSQQLMMMRVSQRLVGRSFFNDLRGVFKSWFPDDDSPQAVLAVRYGKNFLLTPHKRSLHELVREDLVDIADYDPVRNSLLYIGKQQPGRFAPFFWFIFRTFPDVNAAVLLEESVFEAAKLPEPEELAVDLKHLNSAACLKAMPFFKKNRAAKLSTGEVIFVFDDLKKAESVLKAATTPA